MPNEIQTTAQQGNNSVAQTANNGFSMSLQELKQRASMVSQIKSQIMVPNVHFGKIPGCGDKPTLLKNGAEMLCMAFRLASDTKIEVADLGNGHREYTITTMLMSNGELVATGVGSCSTMESKYRYRGNELELVGDCPKDYWNKPRPNKYNGHTAKKDETGAWKLYKKGAKTENPDIADTYNTVLKMASKRSLIDATLKATGGSCEFTQDIEDNPGQFAGGNGEFTAYEEPPQDTAQEFKAEAPAKSKKTEFKEKLAALGKKNPEAFRHLGEMIKAQGWNNSNDIPEDRHAEVLGWWKECEQAAQIENIGNDSDTTEAQEVENG